MPFDLSNVSAQANKVVQSMGGGSNGQGEQREFKYRLVYPGTPGKLSVKLLFNPKANTVSRVVYNHRIDGVNIPCMRTWEMDCPICRALRDVKNATGQDHPQLRSMTRAISLAQYVASDYTIENVNQGDVILLMYPWTVYRDVQQILQQANTPEELSLLVATNEGMVFDIIHGQDNRYSTQINAFTRYKSCPTDEEFENLLNGLDSLNDLYRPSSPTEDQMNTVNDAAKEISNTYLSGSTGQPQYVNPNPARQQTFTQSGFQSQTPPPPPAPNVVPNVQVGNPYDDDIPFRNGSSTNQNPTVTRQQPSPAAQMGFQIPQQAPTMTSSIPSGTPTCFGRHGDPAINPAQCQLCGSELECIENSGR